MRWDKREKRKLIKDGRLKLTNNVTDLDIWHECGIQATRVLVGLGQASMEMKETYRLNRTFMHRNLTKTVYKVHRAFSWPSFFSTSNPTPAKIDMQSRGEECFKSGKWDTRKGGLPKIHLGKLVTKQLGSIYELKDFPTCIFCLFKKPTCEGCCQLCQPCCCEIAQRQSLCQSAKQWRMALASNELTKLTSWAPWAPKHTMCSDVTLTNVSSWWCIDMRWMLIQVIQEENVVWRTRAWCHRRVEDGEVCKDKWQQLKKVIWNLNMICG